MAFSHAIIRQDHRLFVADVISDADADVGPYDIPHLLGSVPVHFTIVPLLANYYLNEWHVSGVDATNISLTGANAVGAGDADPQVRVIAWLDSYLER